MDSRPVPNEARRVASGSAVPRLFGERDNGGGFVDGACPEADDGDCHEARIQHGTAAIERRENAFPGSRLRADPPVRLPHLRQRVDRQQHRSSATEKHGAPTPGCADSKIQSGGEKKSDVITGLQIARTHLAPRLGPDFSHIRARQRPLAADPNTREKPEDTEFPDVLRQRGGGSKHRVKRNSGGECTSPPPAIGQRAPDQRGAPPRQKNGEQHGAGKHNRRRRSVQPRFRKQLGERRGQHQRENEGIHSIQGPPRPGGPEPANLRTRQRHAQRAFLSHRSEPPWFTLRTTSHSSHAAHSSAPCPWYSGATRA